MNHLMNKTNLESIIVGARDDPVPGELEAGDHMVVMTLQYLTLKNYEKYIFKVNGFSDTKRFFMYIRKKKLEKLIVQTYNKES